MILNLGLWSCNKAMPVYEYECEKCGESFETIHGFEEACEKCEHCKSKKISKVIGNVGISFKGKGFHINDYKPGKSDKENKE